MAYADPLDETAPAGNTKVKLGDDAIRTAIRAIRQRLSSLIVDIDADPMVLKPSTVGNDQVIIASLDASHVLQNGSVTAPKMGPLAIQNPAIDDDAILPRNIGPGTFTFDDLNTVAGLQVGGAAAAGKFLKGDGAHFVAADFLATDIPDSLLQKLLMRFDGFFVDNVPGGSGSFFERFRSGGGVDQHVAVMTRAGEIRGVWTRGNADRTGGSFTVFVSKNGVATTAQATIDGAAPRESYTTPAAGAVVFAAGDYLGMTWQSVGLTPAGSTEYIAGFEVRYT